MTRNVRDLWVRRLLALDLGIFTVAMILLALLPPYTLSPPEIVAVVLCAFTLIGVVAEGCQRINLPGEHWAYLMVALIGLYELIGFAASSTAWAWWQRWPVAAFLMSGIASAAAAHVIIGGPPRADG